MGVSPLPAGAAVGRHRDNRGQPTEQDDERQGGRDDSRVGRHGGGRANVSEGLRLCAVCIQYGWSVGVSRLPRTLF